MLKFKSDGDFLVAKKLLKKAGIPTGDLLSALDRFIATHEISFEETANYQVVSNCIYANKATAQGMTLVKLSKFNATISEQIIKDDGSSSDRYYRVEGTLSNGRELPSVLLPVQEFEAMGWIGKVWGADTWFAAGSGVRDNLRAAITYLSEDIPEKYTFAHTGWNNASGEWTFLTEACAIGCKGMVESLTVDLSSSNLSDFSIPQPSDDLDLVEAIKKCFLFLDLPTKDIAYPLFSAVFRAPLGESLPINFALFIVGSTGSYKSEIASLIQGFFGINFAGANLPANWSSSANAIERIAFQAKDVILVVDDYLPGENPRMMNAKADRVFRALGNRAGRQRMNADTSLNKEYFPRSLLLATAEDVPVGQSVTARMLVLGVDKSTVDTEILTELQRQVALGTMNAVMYYYLKRLASEIENLKETLPKRKSTLRLEAIEAEKTHSRTPDIVANLAIGFEQFCEMAVDIGAITPEQSNAMQIDCKENLLKAARKQRTQQDESDPCKRFRNLLIGAFTMGWAHFESISGKAPMRNPDRWGWKSIFGLPDETGISSRSYSSQGSRIGWVDDNFVYLESEAAFNMAQRVGGKDRPITATLKTLRQRLAERKELIQDPATGGIAPFLARLEDLQRKIAEAQNTLEETNKAYRDKLNDIAKADHLIADGNAAKDWLEQHRTEVETLKLDIDRHKTKLNDASENYQKRQEELDTLTQLVADKHGELTQHNFRQL